MGSGQGGCERRIEVSVKIQKEIEVGAVGGGVRWGGRVGGGGGVRVDVNEELKFLGKLKKNIFFFLGGGGGGGRVAFGGGGVGLGVVRVDLNEELKFL